MTKSIAELLMQVAAKKTRAERIDELRRIDSPAVRFILRGAYDPAVKWLLPEGTPPYKESQYPDAHGQLYKELRRLYLYVEGGHPTLTQIRRETLFLQLLESCDAEDAKLMIAVKDKKIPYKGFTSNLVLEAYPGLWVPPEPKTKPPAKKPAAKKTTAKKKKATVAADG